MPTPDATDPSMYRMLLDWAGPIAGGLAAMVWRANEKSIDTLRADHQRQITQNRDDLALLFKKLDDHAARSEQRHTELLTRLSQGPGH